MTMFVYIGLYTISDSMIKVIQNYLGKQPLSPKERYDYAESTHKHISPDAQEETLRSAMV